MTANASADTDFPARPVPGAVPPSGAFWLNRRVLAWASYDIASSAYFGVVPPVVFPVFFLSAVAVGEARFLSWGAAVSAALVVAGCLAPFVGRLSDQSGKRWLLLVTATVACCVAIAGLSLVGPGQVIAAVTLFALAQAAYLLAQPLYESYLTDIATPATTARISSFGWALGFLGGVVAILAILPLAGGGVGPENLHSYRTSFVVIAGIFLALSIPALWAMRRTVEPRGPRPAVARPSLWGTLRSWRDHRELFKLILAFYLVNDGIVTVTVFIASYLQTNFGTTVEQLLFLLLAYTVVAAPATMAFGFLADRWSHRKAISLSLTIWVGIARGCSLRRRRLGSVGHRRAFRICLWIDQRPFSIDGVANGAERPRRRILRIQHIRGTRFGGRRAADLRRAGNGDRQPEDRSPVGPRVPPRRRTRSRHRPSSVVTLRAALPARARAHSFATPLGPGRANDRSRQALRRSASPDFRSTGWIPVWSASRRASRRSTCASGSKVPPALASLSAAVRPRTSAVRSWRSANSAFGSTSTREKHGIGHCRGNVARHLLEANQCGQGEDRRHDDEDRRGVDQGQRKLAGQPRQPRAKTILFRLRHERSPSPAAPGASDAARSDAPI